jgi:transcriptional regulator with XRE-family HTH domain
MIASAGGAMDELRRIRKEQGLSQQRLAELANVDKVTIVHIEGGKVSPKVETLQKLAAALSVELADLFPKAQAPLPLDSPADGAGDPVQAARRIEALPSTAAELASAWNRDVEFYEQHDRSLRPYRTLEMGLAVEGLYQHFWRELSVLQQHAESLGHNPNPASWEPELKELLIEAGSNIHALAELYAVIKQAAADRRGTREDWRALREEFDVQAPAQEPAFLTEDPQWPAAIERARAAAGIA